MLQNSRNVMTIMTMAVAYGEEMAMTQLKHVRVSKVGVLVLLVRVVSRDTTLGSKRKFGHNVCYFLMFFFGSRCCS
jgi:hypothetical protein